MTSRTGSSIKNLLANEPVRMFNKIEIKRAASPLFFCYKYLNSTPHQGLNQPSGFSSSLPLHACVLLVG